MLNSAPNKGDLLAQRKTNQIADMLSRDTPLVERNRCTRLLAADLGLAEHWKAFIGCLLSTGPMKKENSFFKRTH